MSTPAGDGAKSGQSTGTEVQGKRGVEGETSAADRETRKKAKVDYNEEKSGIKKKGEEGSEDDGPEVRFLLAWILSCDLAPGEGGRWQGRPSWSPSGTNRA